MKLKKNAWTLCNTEWPVFCIWLSSSLLDIFKYSFNLKPCLIYSISSSIFYWKQITVKSVCNQFDWTCVTKWPFLCLVREMILWNLTKWAIFSSLSVSSSTSPLVVDDFKNLASTKLSSALLFYRNNELNWINCIKMIRELYLLATVVQASISCDCDCPIPEPPTTG